MSSRLKDIPRLARDGKNLNTVMDGVMEALQTFRGYRGDLLDKALTPRDFAPGVLGGLTSGGIGAGGITIIGGGSGGSGSPYEPDLTPPPTATFPTGRLITAGIASIFIESDRQTYTQGHGHDRTIVYGAKWAASDPTPPTFSEAVELFSFQGTFGAYPSDPATRWCVWIKWKSNDGVPSVDPAGGTNGQQATTGQDVSLLLQALTGQITQSQLFSTLSTRINLIDAADSVAGSVSARVKAETDARVAAITLARSDFASADATTLASANSYVTTYAYSKATVDGSFSALDSTLRSAFASADSATLASANAFTYSRATIDSSIASSASTLTTNYAAADAATLASANAFTYSRSTIDGAISSSASTLTAAYTSAISTERTSTLSAADAAAAARDSTVLSTATAYTYSQATIDSAIASSASTLTANYGSAISSAVSTEASARAALDGSVQALYTVRAQVSAGGTTMVGGFGLAATSTSGGGSTIDFGVIANRFYVGAPAGTGVADETPFIVQTTSTTINGVSIPAGVYMKSAFIYDLTASIARLGNAWIDDAKVANLSAAKLTVGDGTVGGNLKSSSYTGGSGGTPGAGWLLTPAGNVYFNNAILYGTIYAGAGLIGGIEIQSNSIRSNYSAGVSGLALFSDGSAELNNVVVRGAVGFLSNRAGSGTSRTGPGYEQDTDGYRVYDDSGNIRVKLGRLS